MVERHSLCCVNVCYTLSHYNERGVTGSAVYHQNVPDPINSTNNSEANARAMTQNMGVVRSDIIKGGGRAAASAPAFPLKEADPLKKRLYISCANLYANYGFYLLFLTPCISSLFL